MTLLELSNELTNHLLLGILDLELLESKLIGKEYSEKLKICFGTRRGSDLKIPQM